MQKSDSHASIAEQRPRWMKPLKRDGRSFDYRVYPGPGDMRRAGFYGLWLRQQGYTPEQAAELVIAEYPKTREKLGAMAKRAEWPKQ